MATERLENSEKIIFVFNADSNLVEYVPLEARFSMKKKRSLKVLILNKPQVTNNL